MSAMFWRVNVYITGHVAVLIFTYINIKQCPIICIIYISVQVGKSTYTYSSLAPDIIAMAERIYLFHELSCLS